MKSSLIAILIAVLLLTSCGSKNPAPQPVLPFVVTLTPTVTNSAVPPAEILATEPATSITTFTPGVSQTPSENSPTLTASPTYITFIPTPTETLLPPLELPTEQPRAPALVAWTGLPTYAGDSEQGLLFRVEYDPDTWAQTEGNFGEIVLAHRQIEYCTITPWAGRGLPVDWKATHEFRDIGKVSYDVSVVTAQDVVKFVSYVGGDGRILTGFQVVFNAQQEKCLQDSEIILGTLRSFASSPTATPPARTPTPVP